MSKNKICVNAKYFKASKVDSEKGHVMRLFAENKNAIKNLTKYNFGTKNEDINKRYKDSLDGYGTIKKNSNTLIDAVLVFPLEQWENAKMTKQQTNEAIIKIMLDMEKLTGMKPLGYKMHLDEGHEDKNGNFILNPHAHLLFANVCDKDVTITKQEKVVMRGEDGKARKDPRTGKWMYQTDENGDVVTVEKSIDLKGKMPLQYLQGRGSNSVWAMTQDIAAKHLKDFGFDRGEKAENTRKRHFEKNTFVERELENKQKELENVINQVKSEKVKLKDFISQTLEWFSLMLNREIEDKEKLEATKNLENNFIKNLTDNLKVDMADEINIYSQKVNIVSNDETSDINNFDNAFSGKIDKSIKSIISEGERAKERVSRSTKVSSKIKFK